MKGWPSITVSSPASLETLYFHFNYSPCRLPPLPHPPHSSWLPTANVARLGSPGRFPPLLPFPTQNQLGEGVERGGLGGGNGILDGLGEAGLPASTFAALQCWGLRSHAGGLAWMWMEFCKGPPIAFLGDT